jgi:hypothetical protein
MIAVIGADIMGRGLAHAAALGAKKSTFAQQLETDVRIQIGKGTRTANIINDKALKILTKQKGFVDETVLVSDTDENRRPLAQSPENTHN